MGSAEATCRGLSVFRGCFLLWKSIIIQMLKEFEGTTEVVFLLCCLFLLCSWTYKHAKTPWRWFSRSLRLGNAPGISKKSASHTSQLWRELFFWGRFYISEFHMNETEKPIEFWSVYPKVKQLFWGIYWFTTTHDQSTIPSQVPLLTGAMLTGGIGWLIIAKLKETAVS